MCVYAHVPLSKTKREKRISVRNIKGEINQIQGLKKKKNKKPRITGISLSPN